MSDFDPSSATPVDDAPTAFDPSSAMPVEDAPPPSETADRIAGLGQRALGHGAGELYDMPRHVLDAIDTMGDSAANYVRGKLGLSPVKRQPQAPDTPGAAETIDSLNDKLGMPKPQTAGEKIGSAAISSLPSAVLAPEAPIAGAVGSMLGGASSETAKQAGAGPWTQALAGFAGGATTMLPSAVSGGTRALVRGGDRGQSDMQSRIADAAASGTTLDVGQASTSPFMQYVAGLSSKGWGGGPVNKLAEQQGTQLGSRVNDIVDNLSAGNTASPMGAGAGISSGVGNSRTPGTAFGNMRAAEKAAYNKVDTLVPPQSPVDISNFKSTLASHAAPIPGAAQITSLTSPKIATLNEQVDAAIKANGGNTVLPYEAASALKTKLDQSIDWGFNPSDPTTNGALKQLHTSLKDDIDSSAASISPQAKQAVTDARSLYAANQAKRDALVPIIDRAGGPEEVYQAATNGTKKGATKIGQVMSAINPDQQNLVRATVLDKLGRASAAQDAPFNSSTFLTNWTKLDPAAKDALFGTSGVPSNLRGNLDSLTRTIANIREGTKLRNPSGSGEVMGHGAGAIALWEGITHALSGDPHALVATGLGVGANNILARAVTNPRTVQWLANSTKMQNPQAQLPNAVNQLSRLGDNTNDQDAKDLADYLTPTKPVARASGGKVDNHEALVSKLMQRWKSAKRQTDATTKPLLNVPDNTIAKALDIAGSAI